MNVLMLGWELPPHNSGGLGVACWEMCKELSKQSISIKFLLPYKSNHVSDFMEIIPVTNLDPVNIWSIYAQDIKYEKNHTDIVNIFELEQTYTKSVEHYLDSETDVIHAHDWVTFRAGMRAKELLGKPFIVHVHSIESDRAGQKVGNPLIHEIEELGLLNADQIVAVSELTKQKISEEYNIPLSKITVAHNSISPDYISDITGDNSYSYLKEMQNNGYKVICNVGRLTVQKGLNNFLHAASKVIEKEPKTLFLFVGSGEQEFELIRLSADLGIGKNVFFAGFQRGKNLRDAFSIADLFVMPSVSEPFGLTPLEAAAYGTGSMISIQSGVSEVFKNCLKVDFWDIEEMANNMINIIRSDALSNTLSQNAYSEFSKMSWSKNAQILLDLYNSHILKGVTA